MTDTYQTQIEKLRLAMEGLTAQRNMLGEAVFNPAMAALQQQLSVLLEQARLAEQAAAQAVPAEERRLVTILFMDMVGSTSLAETLDPEEWRKVLIKLHTTLGEAIVAHHGEVAQFLGDGLLAFFGAKEASEHDPENAIRAALDAQAAMSKQQWPTKVQARAGIHSGLVVVGELGNLTHTEFTASGDAMNLAARLQSAAPPGGILISHDTYRYVRGVFDMTPRPPLTVKGKSEPLQTYLVRRAKPRPFRSVARGVAGVETRTVGREVEMQALQNAYLRAYEGRGTVWAQLVGEPGVGKSRLLDDLSDWMDLRDETYRLLRARAFPDDANQPFALVRRMWFDRFQIADDAPLQQAEARWVERFREFYGHEESEEAAHALGLLVGLPFQDSPHIKAMRNDPAQVKGRALVVSRALVQAIRQETPLVVLLEDLHWADAASWEYLMEVFLGDTADAQSDGRHNRSPNGVFILGAARPEWRPPQQLEELLEASSMDGSGSDRLEPDVSGENQLAVQKSAPDQWVPHQWGIKITLAPLTDQATRELALELFQRVEAIPEQILTLLVERSEGVPYYTEEIINWFIDHGILDTEVEPWRFLPERMKAQPLPATLQHLLLTRLSALSQPERAALQRGAIFGRRFWTGGVEALGLPAGSEMLGRLQPRGFVDAQPESAFQGDTEWSFHHNLLQEVTYESVLKRERVALHKVAAGWLEQQARQSGRLDEFAGLLGDHYERAGDLSAAADWYLRAGKLAFSQGAPRAAADFYTQALALLPPVDRDRRWLALLGREDAYAGLGEVEPNKANIAALLELAHSFRDDNYLSEAYLRQALLGVRSSELTVGEQAAQAALAAARRCGNEANEAQAMALIALLSFIRGDKLATQQNVEAAIQLARQLNDENVMAFVFFYGANCYSEMGDIARGEALRLEQIELDHRLGNRLREAIGMGNLGLNYSMAGQFKQARLIMEQACRIDEALGARRALGYNLMNLAWIYVAFDDLRKAYQLMERALQEVSPSQDARGIAFALTDLGRILLAMGDPTGAARRLREGREVAIRNELYLLARESEVGLAASEVMQGKPDEARKTIYAAWEYLKDHSQVGLGNPATVYRMCAETFDALGEEESAREVLERAYQFLMEQADTINVPAWRQSFFEDVPDHRAILEMWERSKP